MLVAGETFNIFLLTGISNINIFFKRKKKNVVVNSNIYDYTNKFIRNQHNRFPFERVEDV